MIARLRGEVVEVLANRLVVEFGGVGYDVQVPESVVTQLGELGREITLFIRATYREDDASLYGFATAEQRRLFDLLRDVKGCGPRISLALIGFLGDAGTVQAIAAQDTKALAQTPGIGIRMAERISVELKDKVGDFALAASVQRAVVAARRPAPIPADELVEALMALGYRRQEADEAAAAVRDQADDTPTQLRLALQRLSR